jgi:hypothetical protein
LSLIMPVGSIEPSVTYNVVECFSFLIRYLSIIAHSDLKFIFNEITNIIYHIIYLDDITLLC